MARFGTTRFLFRISIGLLFLLLSGFSDAKAESLLSQVSERYDSLEDYVLGGSATVILPGTDCRIGLPFEVTRFRIGDLLPPPTIVFRAIRVPSRSCRKKVAGFGLTQPGFWADLSTANSGAIGVRELPRQILHLSEPGDVSCSILEVQYDRFSQRVRKIVGPIRYWIEPGSKIVRRVEFNEARTKGQPWQWIVTVERVTVGEPPPPGLQQYALSPPTTIGKAAADVRGQTAQGETIRLLDLRGKVVLLNFWATWCMACLEEIPVLEKLQSDAAFAEVVVLGVSGERSDVVQRWLKRYGRSYKTLVDATNVFAAFGVGPIPARVVINRRGIVTRYFLGFDSENRIRQALEEGLADTSEGSTVDR
jgi:peroxiredoxin